MTPTGRLNVQLRAKPLQFDSGAMVITLVLTAASADRMARMPSASTPSSLVSRTRTVSSREVGVEAPASRRGYGCDMGAQQADAEVGAGTDHGRTVRDSVERRIRPDLRRGP